MIEKSLLLLFPACLNFMQIKGYQSVNVYLLNDEWYRPMVIYYPTSLPWPEFNEKTVTLPINMFVDVPSDCVWDLLSFEINKH